MLMPHESRADYNMMNECTVINNVLLPEEEESDNEMRRPVLDRSQSLVPHLFAETPQNITHQSDSDEDSDHSGKD